MRGRFGALRKGFEPPLGGQAVLFDPESGTDSGLDPVGAFAWEPIAEKGAIGSVHVVMLAEDDVDESALERDIRTPPEDLRAHRPPFARGSVVNRMRQARPA